MNHNITKEGVEVKAGQVWRDLDKRMKGRTVTVIFTCAGVARVKGTRTTELAISRMHRHSTGWELVSAGPASGSPHNAVTPGVRKPGEIASPRNDAELPALDCASKERSQTVGGTPISALVGRLEYWGDHFETSWAKACKEAAQALRVLEAKVAVIECPGFMEHGLQAVGERLTALQHEADKLRGWLKDALDGWKEADILAEPGYADADRIGQIREDAGLK